MTPKQLLIGGLLYDVQEVQNLTRSNVDDGRYHFCNGVAVYQQQRIDVEKDITETLKIVTLFHEAVHILCEQAGINDEPENVVRALGYGLYRLIRDNPDLVSATRDDADPSGR